MNRIHFKSENQFWQTPLDVYSALDKEFKFDFDPCMPTTLWDGLIIEWKQSNYCNPPYSRMKDWCKKAYEEYLKGKTVVMLIPSRTDTRYWHDYCMKATEIRFIKGRLKFQGAKHAAPFPSCIIIFKGEINENKM